MRLMDWIRLSPVFLKCIGRLPVRHLLYMARQMQYEYPHYHNGKIHINAFFPPHPSKAYDRFLKAVFYRRRVPFSTYFAVTDQCPYKCPHCSYGSHVHGHLDTQKAIEIIDQIRSIGTVTCGFTGGEPLLRPDIVDLVRATGEDMASVIFSTGYNLTSDLAAKLKDAGLDCITIGIESDDEKEHNQIRGVNNSWLTTLSAIETSLQAGLYTGISTVAARSKIQNGTLDKLAEMATDWGVHEFRILEPIPTGSYLDHKQEILTSEESKQLADFHKQWNRRGKGPSIACFAHLESDEMFGCGAGYHHLFIDAVGNVCPCDLTPLKMGNALEEPLSQIWNRMSQWFALPRCRCFMKDVCMKTNTLKEASELPIDQQTSEQICLKLKNEPNMPKVFENLLRGYKDKNKNKKENSC